LCTRQRKMLLSMHFLEIVGIGDTTCNSHMPMEPEKVLV
jgi:hypothetical protein